VSDYEYLVSWKGYGPEENTWEPYDNVAECSELGKYLDFIEKRAMPKRCLSKKKAIISHAKKFIM
jgi:hypothetical protein